MSTFPVEIKDRGRKALSDDRAAMHDAPVSGTGLQAESADIVIYASGEADAVDQGSPFLRYPKPHSTSMIRQWLEDEVRGKPEVSVYNLATANALFLG